MVERPMIRIFIFFITFLPVTAKAVDLSEVCAKWLLKNEAISPGSPRTFRASVVETNESWLRSKSGLAVIVAFGADRGVPVAYYFPLDHQNLDHPHRIVLIPSDDIQVARAPGMLAGAFVAGLLSDPPMGSVEVTVDFSSELDRDFYTLSFSDLRIF